MILAVPHVAARAAYALADVTGADGTPLLSLSQNESLRPPSPRAQAAAAQAVSEGHLYPDPDWTDLRRALAAQHGLAPEAILCGAGSMDLIAALARAYADAGNAVLIPAHAYPFFRTAAQLTGARCDAAPEDVAGVSVGALCAAVRPDTRIVFVANPGNPTGTRLARADVVALRDGLPQDVLLVVDEAYGEFADHLEPPVFDLVDRGNTVVLRTLSKAYGLASLRVGWGVFPAEVALQIRKVLLPNNISAVGQAVATAAVSDAAYMRETCALTIEAREACADRLRAAGYAVRPSHTNFVLLDLGTHARARDVAQRLQDAGLVGRLQDGAGLPHALRLTIAPPEVMARAIPLLEHCAAEVLR